MAVIKNIGMKITFYGTNGWFTTLAGQTLCVTIETHDLLIILDAGDGFFSLPLNIAGERKAYLLLSHFHMDHISGLHGLCRMSFPQGLVVAGGKGTPDAITRIVARPYTVPVENLPFPVEFVELGEEPPSLPFQLEWRPMVHADPCLGYRITIEGRTVAFCTDTGYCPGAIELARNADLLITECAFRPGETDDRWPHLNPETAAEIAIQAGVRRLLLTHFDASRYPDKQSRDVAEATARHVFPATTASYDGLCIHL